MHEFDDGLAGLEPFLESSMDPIISCNIIDTNETTFQNKYKKSIVKEFGKTKVGIIGYTSQDVMVYY